MKVLIRLICLLLIGINSYGQDCIFTVNTVDESTKEKTRITEVTLLQSMHGTYARVSFINSSRNLSLKIYYSDKSLWDNTSIQENDKLQITLDNDNDNTITLYPKDPIALKMIEMNGVVSKNITPVYLISDGQLHLLTQNMIVSVSFYFNGRRLEHTIEGKTAKQILTAAACILD